MTRVLPASLPRGASALLRLSGQPPPTSPDTWSPDLWEEGPFSPKVGSRRSRAEAAPGSVHPPVLPTPLLLWQVSTKQKKELQRLEKKKRQEDRHRQKALAGKGGPSDNNTVARDPQAQVTLVKTFATLSI